MKRIIGCYYIWRVNSIIDAKHTSDKTGIDYYKVNITINKYVELGILKVADDSKKEEHMYMKRMLLS